MGFVTCRRRVRISEDQKDQKLIRINTDQNVISKDGVRNLSAQKDQKLVRISKYGLVRTTS